MYTALQGNETPHIKSATERWQTVNVSFQCAILEVGPITINTKSIPQVSWRKIRISQLRCDVTPTLRMQSKSDVKFNIVQIKQYYPSSQYVLWLGRRRCKTYSNNFAVLSLRDNSCTLIHQACMTVSSASPTDNGSLPCWQDWSFLESFASETETTT